VPPPDAGTLMESIGLAGASSWPPYDRPLASGDSRKEGLVADVLMMLIAVASFGLFFALVSWFDRI
jgi:hypothetical protein